MAGDDRASGPDPASDDEGQQARQRQFSRREILRAGMAVPAVLAVPALAAACGGGSSTAAAAGHGDHSDSGNHADHADHGDASHNDTSHSDSAHTDSTHTDKGDLEADADYPQPKDAGDTGDDGEDHERQRKDGGDETHDVAPLALVGDPVGTEDLSGDDGDAEQTRRPSNDEAEQAERGVDV